MTVDIAIYSGKDTLEYLDLISDLRIKIFREFPYLYVGKMEYERKYMQGYATEQQAMIAIARVNGLIVGVSTGIPLTSNSDFVMDAKLALSQSDAKIDNCYYYGEVIVLPEYRRQGIAAKLYSAQDELIAKWGYRHVCILTVVRDDSHPLKPDHYQSPDAMWQHLGFSRMNITVDSHWPTIQADNTTKDASTTLEFWMKTLSV